MTTVVDRPITEPEVRPVEEAKVVPPVTERPPEPELRRFVRWMGWLVALLVGAGLGVIVWSVVSEEPVTPALEAIDPHQNPEVIHMTAGAGLVAPAIEMIDVHESPEVARLAGVGLVAPAIEMIDVHESPEVARLAGAGLVAPSLGTIDSHESPEIQRLGS